MSKKKAEELEERSLLVKTDSGEFRIRIPGDAKLTFGPSIPSPKSERGYGKPLEYALRIYQGSKDNLIAVFTGVREFRGEGMIVEKKIVAEAGKTLWRSDEEGYKVATSVKRKEKFMDAKLIEGELAKDEDGF